MADVLMAGWEGGGNVPAFMTAIRRLVARGHRVRLLGDDAMRDDVIAAGGAFRPWRTAFNRPDRSVDSDQLRDWEANEPGGDLLRVLDVLMIGPAATYAEDTVDEIERERPDVVIASDLMMGPMIAAQARAVKLAVLSANISLVPIEGMPPVGPGLPPPRSEEERRLAAGAAAWYGAALAERLPVLNAARARFGLPPLADALDQVRTADLILLGTSRAFDFPVPRLPARMHYVGPLLDAPHWANDGPPALLGKGPDVPLVVVAMSSSFQDQAGAIQAVLDAAASLPVQVVVTRGPALKGTPFRVPENAEVVDAADHDALMARAACVVTHAGHGTVMRALRHGCALLCLPMGRDQNDNAARVVAHGAGRRLPPSARPGELRAAIEAILAERSYATAARRLGVAIRACEPPQALENWVESLVETPLSRIAL
jgi:MGT family glycosyltransferase